MSEQDRDRHIASAGLSQEQRAAVAHITGPEQIAAVVGFAGAGKSTMLAAARDAWERQGYRVHGAALAGKAAEGLEESSGIASRTLASWDYGWQRGRGELGPKDVFVIDEAGMVSSRQLAMFVGEVQAKGAKLVLVGDHEQLQAIGAGSPFRAIIERVGAVELSEIRRQKQEWQREASTAFATHRTGEGLKRYAERGGVRFLADRDAARAELVADYLADLDQRPTGSRIALAHRRVDVRAINADIRQALQENGMLARGEDGQPEQDKNLGAQRTYQTSNGERGFAAGDRIVLRENNRDLGVKIGMLATVLAVEPNAIQMRLDGNGLNTTRDVTLPVKSYQAFDHGYATTIHKSQGATVDRAFVMASVTMDRHLTYVAMTRHRDEVRLYAGQDELMDIKVLGATLGRSRAKETTLDYTRAFADRRGLLESMTRSEIDVRLDPSQGSDAEAGVEKVEPLVPAVTHYANTVEEVAQAKAMPYLEQDMETVRQVARNVYADPSGVAAVLKFMIIEQKVDIKSLGPATAEVPEQFGPLLGKTGMFGDNSQRKAARHVAGALGAHVGYAVEDWERHFDRERGSETWKREKQDVIEVPGLTPRSERILSDLAEKPNEEKNAFLATIAKTPEGKQALDEAEAIVSALRTRFGSSDPRHLAKNSERLGQNVVSRIGRVVEVARIADHAHRQELSRLYDLTPRLGKGLTIGL